MYEGWLDSFPSCLNFFICWISFQFFCFLIKREVSTDNLPLLTASMQPFSPKSFFFFFPIRSDPTFPISKILTHKKKTAKDTNPLKEEAQFSKSFTFLYMRQESYSAGLCQHSFNDISIAYIQRCKIHQHTVYKNIQLPTHLL